VISLASPREHPVRSVETGRVKWGRYLGRMADMRNLVERNFLVDLPIKRTLI
jgi:hypothetical protein